MASTSAPIEVGTRGTIASLLKKEIEYFCRHQVDCNAASSSAQSHRHVQETASNGKSWPNFKFFPWRRKKRKGTSTASSSAVARPGICSMVEVANCSHRFTEMSHFGYRNLRNDHIQEV